MLRNLVIGASVGLIAALGTPESAAAGFIDNRGQWNNLDQSQQWAYAMGVFDRHVILSTTGEENGDNERARKLQSCAETNRFTSRDLAQLIDDTYAEDIEKWTWPAYSVLMNALWRICLN